MEEKAAPTQEFKEVSNQRKKDKLKKDRKKENLGLLVNKNSHNTGVVHSHVELS
jgi:hypothetical protein